MQDKGMSSYIVIKGAFFMLETYFKLACGFLCGFLYIKCVPFDFPFQASDIIIEFLFNPLEFLGACLFFIMGVLINADILKEGAERIFQHKKISVKEYLSSFFMLLAFLLLCLIGFWQTTVFFCFSLLYGIISLDFQKIRIANE